MLFCIILNTIFAQNVYNSKFEGIAPATTVLRDSTLFLWGKIVFELSNLPLVNSMDPQFLNFILAYNQITTQVASILLIK